MSAHATSASAAPRVLVPRDVLTALATTTFAQSDDVMELIKIIGAIAERLEDTRIIDWVTPFIMKISSHIDAQQAILKAILEENA